MMRGNKICFLLLLFINCTVIAQVNSIVIDQVAAVVGSKTVLKSEIDQQYHQYIQQGNYADINVPCRILDQLMLNKLLLNQAILDSIEITDDQVNQKIDQNLSYFIKQLGSPEKLEEYYGKSIPELKEEFKPVVKEQLLAQQMQGKVTKNITASPLDVKNFFFNISSDSLPLINTEVEYAQIIRNVTISEEKKKEAKSQLETIRQRIVNGEDFGTLSFLYSQDKESAKQNGELGFVNRGDLVPEFEAVAFRLKNGKDVSEIVETKYGFHIIQLIERRGEKINVRHILIKPAISSSDLVSTQELMDSIIIAIRTGNLKFSEAAEKISNDNDTRLNGGIVANPANGAIRFETSEVEPSILFQLDKLEIGEVSNPALITTVEGGQAYRILKLNARTLPHKLNINNDYQRLQDMTLNNKQSKAMEAWKNKKKAITYIRISEEYMNCDQVKSWSNN